MQSGQGWKAEFISRKTVNCHSCDTTKGPWIFAEASCHTQSASLSPCVCRRLQCAFSTSIYNEVLKRESMRIADQCDEIGTTLLLSDADLALTIIQIALSRPAGERRATAIQNAKFAYRRLCELVRCLQMEGNAVQNVATKLEAIRFALDETEGTVLPVKA